MELNELYALMEKFEKSGLSELVFKRAGDEICLKKVLAPPAAPMPVVVQAPAAHVQHENRSATPEPPAPKTPGVDVITAPLVGTFYRAAAPDAPPFVEVGDKVKKGKTICILEAMKLMNEFQAEFDLEIVNILVENGRMVEYGTPLFEVRRT
ncbi:MAG TPA: acetyl-CoA carboxylase biotin carboxyl carrier protein [Spirochaetia bacterium]|nr:acetyl-CoA carboxylase biotin carboxyl carrier protein [Spirochaetia bacterium]